jgi:hypothetical protein
MTENNRITEEASAISGISYIYFLIQRERMDVK